MPDWSSISSQLEKEGVRLARNSAPTPVSGGDISAAWKLAAETGDVFVKTGPLSSREMFSAEVEGLSEIARTGTIRVPEIVASGQSETGVFLALEWLDTEPASAAIERRLGEQLAQMHRAGGERFGWHRDNTIGLTPQHNAWRDDWTEFFRDNRLAFQLQLAAENGFTGKLQTRGTHLIKRLPIYFDDAQPQASLLHGDLWGGNWACSDGDAVIFDPAVYYGDRETDIALTRLFGGFSAAFYAAYESCWPLRDGHRERLHLYQLYHVLNHLNLFGSSYLGRAISLMDELL